MKIGLRGGHSPNCKGAMGILDEQITMLTLFKKVESILKQKGHIVINCCSTESNKSLDLSYGTTLANNNNCELFVSLHMNASNDHKGRGTEAWVYRSGDYPINQLGLRLCNNFAKLGFVNRGIKVNPSFHDLAKTKMPSLIFETCFCDNKSDVDLFNKYSLDTIALNIANAIDPVGIPIQSNPDTIPPSNNTSSSSNSYYRVIVGSYKEKANAEKMVSEMKSKGYNSAFIDIYKK